MFRYTLKSRQAYFTLLCLASGQVSFVVRIQVSFILFYSSQSLGDVRDCYMKPNMSQILG